MHPVVYSMFGASVVLLSAFVSSTAPHIKVEDKPLKTCGFVRVRRGMQKLPPVMFFSIYVPLQQGLKAVFI